MLSLILAELAHTLLSIGLSNWLIYALVPSIEDTSISSFSWRIGGAADDVMLVTLTLFLKDGIGGCEATTWRLGFENWLTLGWEINKACCCGSWKALFPAKFPSVPCINIGLGKFGWWSTLWELVWLSLLMARFSWKKWESWCVLNNWKLVKTWLQNLQAKKSWLKMETTVAMVIDKALYEYFMIIAYIQHFI